MSVKRTEGGSADEQPPFKKGHQEDSDSDSDNERPADCEFMRVVPDPYDSDDYFDEGSDYESATGLKPVRLLSRFEARIAAVDFAAAQRMTIIAQWILEMLICIRTHYILDGIVPLTAPDDPQTSHYFAVFNEGIEDLTRLLIRTMQPDQPNHNLDEDRREIVSLLEEMQRVVEMPLTATVQAPPQVASTPVRMFFFSSSTTVVLDEAEEIANQWYRAVGIKIRSGGRLSKHDIKRLRGLEYFSHVLQQGLKHFSAVTSASIGSRLESVIQTMLPHDWHVIPTPTHLPAYGPYMTPMGPITYHDRMHGSLGALVCGNVGYALDVAIRELSQT